MAEEERQYIVNKFNKIASGNLSNNELTQTYNGLSKSYDQVFIFDLHSVIWLIPCNVSDCFTSFYTVTYSCHMYNVFTYLLLWNF